MAAGVYDIVIDQGADFALQMVVRENGSLRDLTGYSARAQLRERYGDAAPTASFVCTVPNPAGGEVLMSMPNATTSGLTPGTYYYDLELYTSADAEVVRLLRGKARVTPEVTK